MFVEVEEEEEGQGLAHSGLSERSGSGDNECMRRVPASEEHAEHKSSDEKVRLPSLASELERFSREGTVSPASLIRASISCVRWRTRPGLPRTLRRLSLLELRVSVEPCGDETGVKPPEPRTANKASFVSGTATSVAQSARVPMGLLRGPLESLELFIASSDLAEPAPRCSFARARS